MEAKRGSELIKGGEAGISVDPAGIAVPAGKTDALSEGVSKQLGKSRAEFKVAIAQMKPLATRLKDNVESIKSYVDRGLDKKVDLLVFPELSIPGYLVLDLSCDFEFVRANIGALKEVVEYTRGKDITLVVGFIDYKENNRGSDNPEFFNSAAVISKGKILDVVDKTLLPDYDIFWDHRHFKSAEKRHVSEINGKKVGIQICEDLWDKDYPIKVSDELKKDGAEVLVNISASPFNAGKYKTRQELVQNASIKQRVPVIYSNMVGVQDGYEGEVVFDGRSMICMPDGKVAGLGKSFEEDLIIADLNSPAEVLLPEWAPVSEIYHALVGGIREYCARNGFKRVYIGLSGGIDSAVTVALATAALGPENVVGVTMPMEGITSSETFNDALRGAAKLGIRCEQRPIGKIYKAWLSDTTGIYENLQALTRQNQQARIRGQILMECVNQDRQAMVLSTGNKTEMALGYMTLYGDMCGGLAALGDVSKLMVYELAAHINNINEKEIIPYSIIQRVPTAELEPGQTDKANLPADYPVLSPLVEDLVAHQKSKAALYQEYGQSVVDQTARMIARAEYKRRQAPPAIRVTSKAFGAGRRIPLDSAFF